MLAPDAWIWGDDLKRKLIGGLLPVEAITEATRATLNLRVRLSVRYFWWARRRRATHPVLFARPVDGQSAPSDEFLAQEHQCVDRALRHTIIESLGDAPFMAPPPTSAQCVRAAKKSAARAAVES
ncbi:hypothetical protein A5659_13345 [Mycobacterium sp. 1165196.3]|nr:hypothetical protein A5659_13345 [Mycobacterium sp. 1165196.3]OBK98780.1 hypothetical protein A5646_23090 [Mycobacterium sp. 1245499.0]